MGQAQLIQGEGILNGQLQGCTSILLVPLFTAANSHMEQVYNATRECQDKNICKAAFSSSRDHRTTSEVEST